jgi:AsmA protein
MGRIIKYFLYAIGGLFALVLVAGITFALLFDANDYREDIAARVEVATGRVLVIEGDLDLSLFPWLAVEIGKSRLGNAAGFGDEPFASFDRARLSVRLLPLLLRREIVVGAAEIEALIVNLEVNSKGVNNWQDLVEQEEVADEAEPPAASSTKTLDIAGIEIKDAALFYIDTQLNEQYRLSNLNLTTGSVSAGEPIDIRGGFSFEAQPAAISGTVEISSVLAFDTDAAMISLSDFTISGSVTGLSEVPTRFSLSAPGVVLRTEDETADIGSIEVSVVGIDLKADVEVFSYAGSPSPKATISIDAFSPRSLMQTLNIEAPETADPSALGKLIVDAKVAVAEKSIGLSELVLVLDETTFRGELVVPRDADGIFRLDLAADSIDLNRYMEPADDSAAAGAGAADAPVEIPADLIRAVNARGKLTLEKATMGAMRFENVVVALNAGNDSLRIHPISADFFDGNYKGDIRINAAGSVPVLSVNEQISNVSLTSLGRAMFGVDKLTGTINGSFQLSGRGNDMAQIQRTLRGDMSFTLKDGTWEGVDVWYELRRARAIFRQEAPPEPVLPARTRFSEVRATGKVTDGVLRNDDFFAELPFMQLNGHGSVNMPAASVDYSMSARVFDRPEFMQDVSPEELQDLTRVAIPLRITGPLASPKIGIDLEELLEDQIREELEDKIKDKLKDLFKL